MPWCPKCRNEYRKGITMCAECKVELVDSLDDCEKQAFIFDEKDKMERLQSFLAYNDIETDRSPEEVNHDEEKRVYHAYQNSAEKAADNKSSAYTLLVVGGIGFIAVLLIFLGVLPVYQDAGTTKYLVCGVMGAMFILFIVFGFVSMHSSMILYSKAKAEDSLLTEITKWCQANLSGSMVDEGLFEEEELSEEQKYFKRVEKMKNLISDKFLNLDEAFLDHFVDEYYQRLFEEV